jgi:hypothetical protein
VAAADCRPFLPPTRARRSNTFKLVILDECDAMTKDAQFALRRGEARAGLARGGPAFIGDAGTAWGAAAADTGPSLKAAPHPPPPAHPRRPAPPPVIEKYTRNTRFCLICNYVIKIIPALQSRCTRFRFPPLAPEHVRVRLEHVVKEEG